MRLLLLLFLTTFSYHLFAQKIKITTAPSWLIKPVINNNNKTAPDEVSNGYVLSLYERQVNIVNKTEFTHYTRRIFNETGVQNASEVSVTFSPQFQQLTFHYIRLVRNGKTIANVREAEIKVVDEEDESDDFIYNGTKRAFIILKGVEKDDEIDCAYSLSGFNPVFGNHYSDKIYFVSGVQTENYFETITTAASQPLYVRVFNGAPLPEEKTAGDFKIYQWSNPKIGEWSWQSGMPSWYEDEPIVAVSTFKNWKEVISWGNKLFRNYNYPLPGSLQRMIEDWRQKAAGNKEVFAGLATRFVQDKVRYLGLEIGTHTHEPHTPAEVFEQRYGDCKDKALLLATILRQENIDASVALVNTATRHTVSQALPTALAFNHAVVAIWNEEINRYQYVDATITNQRGAFSSLFVPAYGFALVLNEKEYELRQAEGSDHNNTVISETFHLNFDTLAKFSVKTKFSGRAADRNRDDFAGVSVKELGKSYLDFYAKTYEGITTDSVVVVADDSVRNEIDVLENYRIPQAWKTDDNGRKAFTFAAQIIFSKIPDPANMPKDVPLALEYPLSITHVMQFYMPLSWPSSSFEALHIANESYQFDFTPRVDGKVIYLEYFFKTNKDHISSSMREQFKKDYARINDRIQYQLFTTGVASNHFSTPGDTSGTFVFFFLVVALAMGVLLLFLNRLSTYVEYDESTAWPIGGWLIILSISIVLAPIAHIIGFSQDGYFNTSTWVALKDNTSQGLLFVALLNLILQACLFSFAIAICFWFFTRRDIFPKMFTWYIGLYLSCQLLILALYNLNSSTASSNENSSAMAVDLARTLIYSVIWVTYVQKADRVKNTFIKSYKA